jgi:hypothetical protein
MIVIKVMMIPARMTIFIEGALPRGARSAGFTVS